MRRITNTSEYKEVYQKPNRLSRRFFTILYKNCSDLIEPAIGITVSKKVGNAVKRNLVKRRIKAILHSLNDEFNKSVKLVVIAKPTANSASWNELNQDLNLLLNKIK